MSVRPTSDGARAALKSATRQLVRNLGGQEAAASATRLTQSAISKCGSPQYPDYFMPLDVVLDLTKDGRSDVLLAEICRQAGGAFVPLPEADHLTSSRMRLEIARVASDLCAALNTVTNIMAEGADEAGADLMAVEPAISGVIGMLTALRGQITQQKMEAAE